MFRKSIGSKQPRQYNEVVKIQDIDELILPVSGIRW